MTKGRPTPKRSEARRVRRSLAPAATKEARKEEREAARKVRIQQREAYYRGDENALPARDRGPAKRLARDLVDARRSFAEYLMPLVFFVLALSIIRIPAVQFASTIILYLVMFAAIGDTTLLTRRVKREIAKRYPNESTKGITSYVILRASQIRRLRIPRTRVERGAQI